MIPSNVSQSTENSQDDAVEPLDTNAHMTEQLKDIKQSVSPEQYSRFIDILNFQRDAMLSSAHAISGADPAQFDRFLDTMRIFANSMEDQIISANKPVADTITQIRELVEKLNHGKIINPRTGKQELANQ